MADPICWLDVVEPEDADGLLADTYERIRRCDGSVHNLYKAMSLRPEPILWADGHYRAVLHNSENALPEWFLELVATMVARLGNCAYARTHHGGRVGGVVTEPRPPQSRTCAANASGSSHDSFAQGWAACRRTRAGGSGY